MLPAVRHHSYSGSEYHRIIARKSPTTISYALLGQLAIRPHAAYDLARLSSRFRDIFWTTAESVVYAELRNLAGHALATEHPTSVGRRRRTIYEITPLGRQALSDWLASDSATLAIQHEAMLKVLFADSGTKHDLLRAIGEVRAWAEKRLTNGKAIAAGYLDGTAPYMQRAHIVTLTFSYQYTQAEQMLAWAKAATAEVATWPDDLHHTTFNRATFEHAVDNG
ncbi:MAG: PadR family transcriptional regulator [Actinobacteria bacterium]|nr:PadR family transcriptional regulator [Actinomycetota bacterium]